MTTPATSGIADGVAPELVSGTTSLAAAKPKLRPATVWPVILVLMIIGALIVPETDDGDFGDFRLTTHSTGKFGARGMYEVLTSLGWHMSRREHSLRTGLDTGTVYMILQPVTPISPDEDSALVRMVRAGGRLFIASTDSAFTAQFRMWSAPDTSQIGERGGNNSLSVAGDSAGLVYQSSSHNPLFGADFRSGAIIHVVPSPNDTLAVFAWRSVNHSDSSTAPALMLGRRIGRGRVVFIADPGMLGNDVLREGKMAMAAERSIEWLDPPTRQVVVDEYHQGFQTNTDGNVIIDALFDTPAGRVTLQLVLASLVLMVAVGVRAILPTPVTVLQRRSPLEHVDALARAYAQIHATRLGAQRLLRGIRRRHPMGIGGRGINSDTAYLDAVRTRYRIEQDDVTALTTALRGSVSDDEFLQAGRAVGRMEHSITTQ